MQSHEDLPACAYCEACCDKPLPLERSVRLTGSCYAQLSQAWPLR